MTDTTLRVYGTPGRSIAAAGRAKYGAAAASRGDFIEQATAKALEHWLGQRPDAEAFRLFHDLGNFHEVSGHGLGPVSLGTANIDHLVLTGSTYALIDSKGTGAGTLTVDEHGRGVLVQPDGTTKAQPWLDSRKNHSAMGVVYRLTGLRGWPVWVAPDATVIDPGVGKARAFGDPPCGVITNISDVYGAVLNGLFPVPQVSPARRVVAALMRHLSDPPDEGIAPAANAKVR